MTVRNKLKASQFQLLQKLSLQLKVLTITGAAATEFATVIVTTSMSSNVTVTSTVASGTSVMLESTVDCEAINKDDEVIDLNVFCQL